MNNVISGEILMRDYGIVVAADLPSSEEVVQLAEVVGDSIDGFKVGVATLLESGTDVLKRIRDQIGQKPILVDLKIADIGFFSDKGWNGTNAKIIKALEGTGATHVTVHGFPGPASVAEAVNAASAAGIGVLLLPLMSHAGANLFFSRSVAPPDVVMAAREASVDLSLPDEAGCSDVTEGILLLGEALTVAGYIGPATRPIDLKRYRAMTERPLWCPGFGRQDRLGRNLEAQFTDWAAIVGPASAAIVGSAIFGAPDRAAAAKEIAEIRDRVVSR